MYLSAIRVLVSTDVAAMGLDVEHLNLSINNGEEISYNVFTINTHLSRGP